MLVSPCELFCLLVQRLTREPAILSFSRPDSNLHCVQPFAFCEAMILTEVLMQRFIWSITMGVRVRLGSTKKQSGFVPYQKMAVMTRRYMASVLNEEQKEFLRRLPLQFQLQRQENYVLSLSREAVLLLRGIEALLRSVLVSSRACALISVPELSL